VAERNGDWSLAGRLTRLYLASTGLFVIAIGGASAVFLQRAVETEIDQLVHEEIAELQAAHTLVERFDPEFFRSMASNLAFQHPENPLAWRAWPADGGPPVDVGHVRLLDALPPSQTSLNTVGVADDGLRSLSARLNEGTVVGLVLDGSAQQRLFDRFLLVAGIVVAVCLAASAILARVVFRRVSSLLQEVAEQASAVRIAPPSEVVGAEGAPIEIRAVSDALRSLQDRIRAEAEEARVFTAGLAHELRSPVQNLVGETEVALLARREPAAYETLLRSHLDEMRQLGDAIDNLVTICSRGPAGRSAEREEFDVAEEADMRLRRHRASAVRRGVVVEIRSTGDTRIEGDREALLRAVRNLVQNAIEWSPAGGRVSVLVEGGPRELCVTVDDAGPGVAPEQRARIFDPFYRGPSAEGRRVGYGLGLALVRGAVEDHGGLVEVGVSPLGGARFRIVLPRAAATSRVA
jgi:two-component system heavy metal sensor histidine kinase CusS